MNANRNADGQMKRAHNYHIRFSIQCSRMVHMSRLFNMSRARRFRIDEYSYCVMKTTMCGGPAKNGAANWNRIVFTWSIDRSLLVNLFIGQCAATIFQSIILLDIFMSRNYALVYRQNVIIKMTFTSNSTDCRPLLARAPRSHRLWTAARNKKKNSPHLLFALHVV